MNPVDGVNAFDAFHSQGKGSHLLANDPLLMLRFEGVIILLSLSEHNFLLSFLFF